MFEEKLDDIIIAVVLFLSLMCRILVVLPLSCLRRFALAFPLFTASLALVAGGLLIVDKAVAGGVDHRLFGIATIVAMFGTAAIIAAMLPMKFPELEHIDHKSISPNRDDWLENL